MLFKRSNFTMLTPFQVPYHDQPIGSLPPPSTHLHLERLIRERQKADPRFNRIWHDQCRLGTQGQFDAGHHSMDSLLRIMEAIDTDTVTPLTETNTDQRGRSTERTSQTTTRHRGGPDVGTLDKPRTPANSRTRYPNGTSATRPATPAGRRMVPR